MDTDEGKKQNIGGKIKGVITDFFKYWKMPSQNNAVPNKEIVSFSLGGMGVKTLAAVNNYIQMTATCLLMGSVYKLGPSALLILYIISTVISIFKAPFASWLIDNTHTKMGKFRPYMLWAGIPCLIGIFGVCFFVPVDGTVTAKMISIAVFSNIYLIGTQVQTSAYVGLSQVISPYTGERNKILSFTEVLANLGPSLLQLLLPLFAGWIFGADGLLNLKAYRLLLPIFAALSFAIGLIIMFYTKERVIVAKTAVEKVKFIEGIKIVGRNRDFWIVTISKFFNGFKLSLNLLLSWICLYQLMSSAMYGVLPTIVNTAYVPGMILAPLLMKKIGNGKSAFASFALNSIAALIMLLTFKRGVAFFVIALYLFNFALGPQYIMQTSITADALDEIQLKYGVRVEGFAQNFQSVFDTLGGVVAQLCFMFIYESFGLKEGADGITDYSVLTDAAIREPIISWVIVVVMIASLLSAIPFLFCKMTSKRHEEIVAELKRIKAEQEEQLTAKLPCDEPEIAA